MYMKKIILPFVFLLCLKLIAQTDTTIIPNQTDTRVITTGVITLVSE